MHNNHTTACDDTVTMSIGYTWSRIHGMQNIRVYE